MKPTIEQVLGQTDNHITWLSQYIGVHQQMLPAFQQMQAAAAQDGINLQIISGFRSFDRQLAIWQRKQSGELLIKDINNNIVNINQCSIEEKIMSTLLYSALPGTSRHHWGTDIDVYDPSALKPTEKCQLEACEYEETGPFHPLFLWLNKHASDFGFFFPYQEYQGGIAAEPWHLSYQPLAQLFHQEININSLRQAITTADMSHKNEVMANLDYIFKRFVNNICSHKVTEK